MKISYRKGNLLDVQAGVIVHGCNSLGVMGAGVAKAIKDKYPFAFTKYVNDLRLGVTLGGVSEYVHGNLVICSAITQASVGTSGRHVSYDAVDKCFQRIQTYYQPDTIINFPKIGAGLGGGDWDIIERIIEKALPDHELVCWEL